MKKIEIDANKEKQRLDKSLSELDSTLSRTAIQRLID